MRNVVKPKLVVLDTDVDALQQVSRSASEVFQVIPTRDGRWASAWLTQSRHVRVVIAAERAANGSQAIELLREARRVRPDIRRVLLAATAQSGEDAIHCGDADVIIDADLPCDELLDLLCDASDAKVCA